MRTSLVLRGRGWLVAPGCLVLAKEAPPSQLPVPSLSGPLPHNKGKSKDKQQAYPGGVTEGPSSSYSACGALLSSLLLCRTPRSVLSAPHARTHSPAPSPHHSHIKTYLAGPQEAGTQGWFQSIKAGRAKEKGRHQRVGVG